MIKKIVLALVVLLAIATHFKLSSIIFSGPKLEGYIEVREIRRYRSNDT